MGKSVQLRCNLSLKSPQETVSRNSYPHENRNFAVAWSKTLNQREVHEVLISIVFFNNLFSSLWIYINWSWQLIEEFTIKRPSCILRLVKWYQNSRVIKSFHLHYRYSSKPFLAKPYHQSIWSTMCFNPLEPRVRFKQNYRTQHGKRPIYTIVTNLNNFTTEFYSFTTET